MPLTQTCLWIPNAPCAARRPPAACRRWPAPLQHHLHTPPYPGSSTICILVPTQVLTSSTLNELSGRNLHFKAEIFQRGGSFKIRGACNSVFALPEEAAARGVVAHSSGNHAAAVALAAKLRGIPAHVVVPSDTPAIKQAAIRTYGVEPIL